MVSVTLRVRARFRMKGRIDSRRFRAEPGQHVEDDMVEPNAYRIVENLHGQMSITEMPGNPRKMGRSTGPDVDDVFCPCPDPHRTAVAEFQTVAVRQCPRFRKVEEKLASGRCPHGNAAAMPLVVPANEQGAGFMAAGYARASGKVGC